MANQMGRPKSKNPASNQLRIRLNDKDLAKLKECSDSLKITMSDVVRKGIDRIHSELLQKK